MRFRHLSVGWLPTGLARRPGVAVQGLEATQSGHALCIGHRGCVTVSAKPRSFHDAASVPYIYGPNTRVDEGRVEAGNAFISSCLQMLLTDKTTRFCVLLVILDTLACYTVPGSCFARKES